MQIIVHILDGTTIELQPYSDGSNETWGQICQRCCESSLLHPPKLLQLLTSLHPHERLTQYRFRYGDGNATLIFPTWSNDGLNSSVEIVEAIVEANVVFKLRGAPASKVQNIMPAIKYSSWLQAQPTTKKKVEVDLWLERIGAEKIQLPFPMTQVPFPVNDNWTNVLTVKEHEQFEGVVDIFNVEKLSESNNVKKIAAPIDASTAASSTDEGVDINEQQKDEKQKTAGKAAKEKSSVEEDGEANKVAPWITYRRAASEFKNTTEGEEEGKEEQSAKKKKKKMAASASKKETVDDGEKKSPTKKKDVAAKKAPSTAAAATEKSSELKQSARKQEKMCDEVEHAKPRPAKKRTKNSKKEGNSEEEEDSKPAASTTKSSAAAKKASDKNKVAVNDVDDENWVRPNWFERFYFDVQPKIMKEYPELEFLEVRKKVIQVYHALDKEEKERYAHEEKAALIRFKKYQYKQKKEKMININSRSEFSEDGDDDIAQIDITLAVAQSRAALHNTLYLWDGILETASEWPDGGRAANVNTDSFGRPLGNFPLKWKGHVACLKGCPDSRSIGVPKEDLFRDTTLSSNFSIEGTAVEHGGGGDMEGKHPRDHRIAYIATLKPTSSASMLRRSNEDHELWLPTMRYHDVRSDWDGKQLIEAVVVGRGRNDNGPFIEAGWVKFAQDESGLIDYKAGKIRLTIGRRYLRADDERAQWSLAMLKNRVMLDVVRPRPDLRSSSRPPTLLPPWHSCALHSGASASGGKRKHEDDVSALPLPLPHGKPFTLKLYWKNSRIEANTMWEDQCWGCGGKILADEDTCDRVSVYWEIWSYEEPIHDILKGEFCINKPECILKALPQMLVISGKYARTLRSRGWFIIAGSESGFWDAIRDNEAWYRRLTEAGWEDDRNWSYAPGGDAFGHPNAGSFNP